MGNKELMSYTYEGVNSIEDRYNSTEAEDCVGLWLLDFQMRMRKKFNYVEIIRNIRQEEEKLKETAWCELFHARILPNVCKLRKQCGYDCDACRGLSFQTLS